MEYTFINNDFNFCRIVKEDNNITLYENEILVLNAYDLQIKDFTIPLDPIYINKYLLLVDYYKGVQLIDAYSCSFFKIRAVWSAFIIADLAVLITHKKIYFIDCKTKTLIESINYSENCKIEYSENHILFYRINRNKSYLWECDTNKTYNLVNIGKSEGLIRRILVKNDILYIIKFDSIETYNLATNDFKIEFLKDVSGPISPLGSYYTSLIKIDINDNIRVDISSELIHIMKQLYLKFGLYISGNYLDANDYEDIYFKNLITELYNLLNQVSNKIDTYDKYLKLKEDYIDLDKRFAEYFNKLI